MKERELRRQCRKLLNELEIRPPLDVAELCRRVGQQRRRRIQLVPYHIPVPGPFGVWVATSAADYIVFQQETSKAHQCHIILHELGHIMAGHRSDEGDDALLAELYPDTEPDALRQRFPDLAPDAVRRGLRRTHYDTEQEREAETVATIILEWASVLDHVASQSSADVAAQRMGNSLSDRLGWL
ncbi:hypothetical protein F0L68_39305 [Solihabitans fulvus]|uniref:IrrE N-terminal-like domain-containing protein n=1 Tax=Solihabitans fulvus TaxID=1892852 RepID=A0A5B2WFT3_9PSEU|nr:hypothetical protein [Solihabitans fulvus]KAA2249540.1 hypothetical protein F0L68_39305 [Solihabitans fulvus]